MAENYKRTFIQSDGILGKNEMSIACIQISPHFFLQIFYPEHQPHPTSDLFHASLHKFHDARGCPTIWPPLNAHGHPILHRESL